MADRSNKSNDVLKKLSDGKTLCSEMNNASSNTNFLFMRRHDAMILHLESTKQSLVAQNQRAQNEMKKRLQKYVQRKRIIMRLIRNVSPQHVWSFHPGVLIFGLYWYAYIFYDYSSFISVFLAIVKCACVAKPLRFKSMFTKSRTLTALAVLLLTAVALRLPVLFVVGFTWKINPLTNRTFLTTTLHRNYKEIYKASDIVNRNIISWLTYFTVIACVILLVSKLRAASRFRQTLASLQSAQQATVQTNPGTLDEKQKHLKGPVLTPVSTREPNTETNKPLERMSARDVQVIQSVTMICVIFIVFQLPFQVISTIRLINPSFNEGTSSYLAYGFATTISAMFTQVNAASNIFVHYHFNARYREKLRSFFACSS
ncbi:chemosensory receptor C [Elysia marginata]|uniref:Chemosensory receptor C n=1 Tax=Elysia marginata TaxID=1093978 RepID=A0AAV4FAN0_9GAST|nr:chemosensory receptor C [Elysia marginata]